MPNLKFFSSVLLDMDEIDNSAGLKEECFFEDSETGSKLYKIEVSSFEKLWDDRGTCAKPFGEQLNVIARFCFEF